MTSLHRRLAASVLGVDRSGRRPPTADQQSPLPLKRRLLASILGIRVRPSVPRASATAVKVTKAGKVTKAAKAGKAAPTVRPTRAAPPRADLTELAPQPVPRPTPSSRRTPSYAQGGGSSVPQHLLSEDRQEYERILDEALRSAPHRPELAAVGQRLNPEQLRTMALNATALVTPAAATEYQHYVKVREEQRRPAPSTPAPDSARDERGVGLATSMGEVAETGGAGAVAVVAVLTPVLFGIAAAIFLLVGGILKLLDPEPAFAQTMLTVGWVFGAMTGAAILVAAVMLLLTALRNRPDLEAGPYGEMGEEVSRAREAWREALLERGILPFLREALADPGTAALHRTAPPPPTSPMPHLGYDRPGFGSPDDGASGPRPSFTSPDYTSPDFGGPDHRPD